MRIKLIKPNLADVRSSDAMVPLSLAILAALTPPDVELSLVDERLEAVSYDAPPDLVAITVETFTAKSAYRIAAGFRGRGVPVVMGGYHPTFMAEEALQHADAVVIGDAEGLWEQVVRDARCGGLGRVYQRQDRPPLAGLVPDRSIFQGRRYLPLSLVSFGRGCRFACDFCSIHAFYGSTPRQRPVREVVEEIERLGRQHVLFVDDNLLADPAQAAELCRALIPLNIRWSCQASIDVCQNAELLRLMAASGCQVVLIGFESLDERNLRQMNKHWGLNGGDYALAIRKLQDHGIMVVGTFVLGYDHDTVDAFEATVDFAIRSRMFLANFNPLAPMPGTVLYGRLQAEGRLLYDRWWLAPGFRYGQTMFRPRNMTAEQLAEGCLRARQTFNSYGSICRRALDWSANCRTPRHLGTFLLGNWVSRNEIRRKQGLVLGATGGGA